MRTIIVMIFIFLLPGISAFGQETKKNDQGSAVDTSLDKSSNKDGSKSENYIEEKMPLFPGGEEALLKFVNENKKYPKEAKKSKIHGKVYIVFVVDKEGWVRDPKVKKGIGGGCDEEALRIVQLMPQWSPGTQNGRPVNVQFSLPILF